jgi:hypothetical protein
MQAVSAETLSISLVVRSRRSKLPAVAEERQSSDSAGMVAPLMACSRVNHSLLEEMMMEVIVLQM